MKKKILSILLAVVMIATMAVPSAAAAKTVKKARTLEEIINDMTLTPLQTDAWPKEYSDMILDGFDKDMTNYQKMKAVYNEWAGADLDGVNCVGYAAALQTAFEVIGFRTYHIRGEVTTANGGWTEHSWVGVVVGGHMVYFDTNLPGKYKAKGNFFGVLPKNATWYRNAEIMKLYVSPLSPIYWSGGTCAIDAEDRADYRLVPVTADYQPKGYATGLKGID